MIIFLLAVYITITLKQRPGLISTRILLTPGWAPAPAFQQQRGSPAPAPCGPAGGLGRGSLGCVGRAGNGASDAGPGVDRLASCAHSGQLAREIVRDIFFIFMNYKL